MLFFSRLILLAILPPCHIFILIRPDKARCVFWILESLAPYAVVIAGVRVLLGHTGYLKTRCSGLHLLRGIVNHSYSKSQLDSDWNKSQMDNSERNIADNRLSNTNRYEVLEKYDEVENEEIGTKSTT